MCFARTVAIVFVATLSAWALAQPLGTSFTYQGVLDQSGTPAIGVFDLRFRLFDSAAGGAQVGPTLCGDNTPVSAGRFAMTLDFGAVFSGQRRWLEIEVRQDTGLDCTNAAGFAVLAPRQELTAAPHAAFALNATQLNGQPASFYTNAGNLTGTLPGGVLAGTYAGALTLSNAGNVFTGSGAGLTGLNASDLASGTVPDARLSANVALLGGAQTFSGAKTFGVAPSFTAAGAPFSVTSAGLVPNLNADLLDGVDASAFLQAIPVPLALSGSDVGEIVRGENASAVAYNAGVRGRATSTDPIISYGVVGDSAAGTGRGVFGWATSATGATNGVFGRSDSDTGTGVRGLASALTGFTRGVLGSNISPDGAGVHGLIISSFGEGMGTGALGESDALNGNGVLGYAYSVSEFHEPWGVGGTAYSPTGVGVRAINRDTSVGYPSYALWATTDNTNGVAGRFDGALEVNGPASITGSLSAATIAGSGASLTDLNASALTSGTVPGARLAGSYSGALTFSNAANSFAGSGAGLTALNASNLASGLLPGARLAGTYSGSVTFNNAANNFAGSGAGLTALNASNLASGLLPGARLAGTYSGALTFDNGANAFTGSGAGLTALDASNVTTGTLSAARLPVPLALIGSTTGGVLRGENSAAISGAAGVSGTATNTSSWTTYGVYGEAAATNGRGVYGRATAATGQTYGGYFYSASTTGTGVYASGQWRGVWGTTTSSGWAGYFDGRGYFSDSLGIGITNPSARLHVMGTAAPPGALPAAENGLLLGSNGTASYKWLQSYGGSLALNPAGNSVGINTSAPTNSLTVSGNANVTGTLSKGGGSFLIDHPLDPENKFLFHSFVESPDMMNIYNGNAVTDESGYATIELPAWFEALNRDFRYQLTIVDDGESLPDFVVARVVRKIADNRFTLKSSVPGVEVSWQVTGVRKDAWANANRIRVEVDKEDDHKGRYLHPEALGKPTSLGIYSAGAREKPAPGPN